MDENDGEPHFLDLLPQLLTDIKIKTTTFWLSLRQFEERKGVVTKLCTYLGLLMYNRMFDFLKLGAYRLGEGHLALNR